MLSALSKMQERRPLDRGREPSTIATPMAEAPFRALAGVCDVALFRGQRAGPAPDLLLEVPHGATDAADYTALRAQLRSPLPPDLQHFFFANTDTGAPEVALATARLVVEQDPARSALVLRCRIPRTFIDCNRVIDEATPADAASAMTPGLQVWITDPADRRLLLERYRAYRQLASAAFAQVCGQGGQALMVHSYAPRSVDVPVDERIVEHLHAAYAPDRIGSWPLRPPVDLIARDPDGALLASTTMLARAQEAFAAAGTATAVSATYPLHPSTLAWHFARQHPGRTLCLELRRDLLVAEFTPFQAMRVDPQQVERVARVLGSAIAGARADERVSRR